MADLGQARPMIDKSDNSSLPADIADLDELGPGAQQFIERMGLYFEGLGVPRIGGRILGLLMLAERPLTLDDMARLLKVSRGSVSTNARLSVAAGMVQHVSLPGDRRDYYVFSPDAWTRRMAVALPLLDLMQDIAQQGIGSLDPVHTIAHDRLQTAVEFCDFYRRETEASIVRWQEYLEARNGGAQPAANE